MASPLNHAAFAADHPPGGANVNGDGVEGQQGPAETSDESVCEECGAAAAWRCDSCSASFCAAHDAQAHQLKVTRSHVRVPIVGGGAGAAPAAASPSGAVGPSPNCSLHPDQPKSVYCSDCEVVVCTFCCDGHGKHNKHATQPDLALAVKQVLLRRQGLAASLKGKHGGAEQVEKDFAAAQKLQQKLAASTARSLQLLDAVSKQLHAAVDARCKELADFIRSKDTAGSSALQLFVQSTREASQAYENLAAFIAAASPPGASPLQILSQEELVSARFADASRKITQYAKPVRVQRAELAMDPTATIRVIQALGTLVRAETLSKSVILTDDSNAKLATFFYKEPTFVDAKFKLLYRGSRDGWTYDDWAAKCVGQANTLTLIKVVGSGNVMGGFIAPAWSQAGNWIADPSLRSFVFSLINAHRRPVKFKMTTPTHAAYHETDWVRLCSTSIALMQGKSALNEPFANVDAGVMGGHAVLDDEYERKQGLTKLTFSLGPGLMSGIPGGRFACAEIEVFAMQA